jgi:hypothetical protein
MSSPGEKISSGGDGGASVGGRRDGATGCWRGSVARIGKGSGDGGVAAGCSGAARRGGAGQLAARLNRRRANRRRVAAPLVKQIESREEEEGSVSRVVLQKGKWLGGLL